MKSSHLPARFRAALLLANHRPLVCIAVVFSVCSPSLVADERAEFFEKHIRPMFVQKCAECHTGSTPEGDLRIDSMDALTKGGMSGPSVVVRDVEASLLFQRVTTEDPELLMPPEKRLSDSEVESLKKWIADGAYWPEKEAAWESSADRAAHWAFQPVQKPEIPVVDNAAWCRTPIDTFISAGHVRNGVTPVEAADRRTLIRRATLDLTGLPPEIADVEAFVADTSPNAFATVVDRLLAGPAYGERWGRH
ncbi:MAG: DUF1549 domain-containing protein, partial [Planctomycetaceae bacterium]|nr:DUF1549 domain-containing protein [Planctomycetaceae bacterium]